MTESEIVRETVDIGALTEPDGGTLQNPTATSPSSPRADHASSASRPTVRARMIVNPRAGRGRTDVSPALTVLAAHGWDVTISRKHIDGGGKRLARQAAQDGCDVVIACGGDGTIQDVVNGLVGTDVAIGVLPAGTANVWAHEVGIALDLEAAAFQLVGAERRHVDVGHVKIVKGRRRHFLLMAGLGFDGAVEAHVSRSLENRIGALATVWAGFRAMASARRTPVQVNLDGVRWQGSVAQIVVGNTRLYGDFTRMTPDAYVDDGRLDICLLTTHGLLQFGRQLASLLLQKRPSRTSTVTDRVGQFTVTSPVALPLQLDGSHFRQWKRSSRNSTATNHVQKFEEGAKGAGAEYRFSVVPQGITMLLPRDHDGQLFSTGTKAQKDKARAEELQVAAVGGGEITAVRPASGHVVTVTVSQRTETHDATGSEQSLETFIGGLNEGDRLLVWGNWNNGHSVIKARQLRPVSPTNGSTS